MTFDEAVICARPLEARFGMTGRFWGNAVEKAYWNLLIAYDFDHAEAVIADALRRQNDPPTDRDLERLLNARQSNDADAYKPPPGFEDVRRGKNGKRIFEQAFRKAYAELPVYDVDETDKIVREGGQQYGRPIVASYGKPVPEEWDRKFRHWNEIGATNADLGADITKRVYIPDPAKYDPFTDEDEAPVIAPRRPSSSGSLKPAGELVGAWMEE